MHDSVLEIRTRWHETDAAGILHFTSFLKHFETAEFEFLRELGISHDEMFRKSRLCFPLAEVHCEYLKPATYGEILQITCSIEAVSTKSVTFEFSAIRKSNSQTVCRARFRTVYARAAEGKLISTPIPDVIAKKLKKGIHGLNA